MRMLRDGWKVRSRFLPFEPLPDLVKQIGVPGDADKPIGLPAYATMISRGPIEKTIITGIGIGLADDNGEIKLSAIGRAAIERCTHCYEPSGALYLVFCEHEDTARDRAINALLAADDGDIVFVVAADAGIVDAVLMPMTFGLEM